MPERADVDVRTIVRLAAKSTAAQVALALLGLLALAEAIPAFRHSVTQELPFATSVVSGVLLLIVTVTVVEGYLARLEAAQEERERLAAEKATQVSSKRVFGDLGAVVKPASGVVFEAQYQLLNAHDKPDLDRTALAEPITAAARALTQTLNGWLPLLLARDDLKDALDHAEEALKKLELAAWLVGDAGATRNDGTVDLVAKSLTEHGNWFRERESELLEAEYDEFKAKYA